jgi:hypothetical protein
MEIKDLPNWQAFEHELDELRAQLKYLNTSLLFRGQADSDWPLSTTLERAGCDGLQFDTYYRLVTSAVRPAVETFTGVVWDIPEYDTNLESAFLNDPELLSFRRFPGVPLYRYMVYLRHHGLPSPLLDWTRSPHVSAFFAFRDQTTMSQKRAIYAYCEMPMVHKGGPVGEATIVPIGPYVRSHPRHFRQQSDYTICGNFDQLLGWCFHPHGSVFGNRPGQDFLWKFTLPSTERIPVLRMLNDYNLNAFSLFDSEESLLETAWFREWTLKRP